MGIETQFCFPGLARLERFSQEQNGVEGDALKSGKSSGAQESWHRSAPGECVNLTAYRRYSKPSINNSSGVTMRGANPCS
jgi:hypothetical protein